MLNLTESQTVALAEILGDEAQRCDTQARVQQRKRASAHKANIVAFWTQRAETCRELLKATQGEI